MINMGRGRCFSVFVIQENMIAPYMFQGDPLLVLKLQFVCLKSLCCAIGVAYKCYETFRGRSVLIMLYSWMWKSRGYAFSWSINHTGYSCSWHGAQLTTLKRKMLILFACKLTMYFPATIVIFDHLVDTPMHNATLCWPYVCTAHILLPLSTI